MSLLGRLVAKIHGSSLPTFENAEHAREFLLQNRDKALHAFMSEHASDLMLDHSVESLDRVERWFLTSGMPASGRGGYAVPNAIAYYFGEVLCKAAQFHWVVQEFAFEPGKYEIGVQRGPASIMLARGWIFPSSGNARMESLSRSARKYAL